MNVPTEIARMLVAQQQQPAPQYAQPGVAPVYMSPQQARETGARYTPPPVIPPAQRFTPQPVPGGVIGHGMAIRDQKLAAMRNAKSSRRRPPAPVI